MLTSLYVRATNRIASVRNQKGATAVEYGLMVALIAIAIIGTVTILGSRLNDTFTFISGKLPSTP